jgi:hypothetical protein
MSEYYIKQPDTDHTRGPLSLEQMVSLAETGTITEDTLLYDEVTEKWKPFLSYPDLIPIVFPEKRILTLNREEEAPTEKEVIDEIAVGTKKPKISSESILAAASGDTKQTRQVGNLRRSREKAAEVAIPGIGTLLLVTAFALIYPAKTDVLAAIQNQSLISALGNPLILFGAIDLALAALVFMEVTSVFPYIRASAAIGCGFMLYLFWAWGSPLLMGVALLMCGGLFLSTISTRYSWMLLGLILGITGATVLAYAGVAEMLVY